ncbi:hypothetical protein BDFB_005136 [Asbolus verrucosus]|uniref:Uncharacterized protein n=1 Tax=Asbolus verrucosus TaxID=1661398 RepID=A0A482VSE4_ASBVE|nr:hypothetical protein BDFB_005136 [Asbolus verrucosus]
MKFSEREAEAAITIQRCVRRYLQRNNGDIKSSITPVDENDNNLQEIPASEQLGVKADAKKVLDELNLFYKKLYSNLKKKEEIKKLCASIDEISSNLKAITKLEQCKELETSFCDDVNLEAVKRRHQEQIKQMNLKWWERLDIYENAQSNPIFKLNVKDEF